MPCDLVAVVLGVRPARPANIPRSHGPLAHAAAVNLLESMAPGLIGTLHAPGVRRRPFTASQLSAPSRQIQEALHLNPDRVYRWRLTGLTAQVCSGLLGITPGVRGIRVGRAELDVLSIAVSSDQHPAAGQDSYAEIWRRSQGSHLRSVTLRVLTPTTFRATRYEQPYPLPRLVFGHLMDTWNAFSGLVLTGIHRRAWDRYLQLVNWYGRTLREELIAPKDQPPRGTQGGRRGFHGTTGFVGKFTYRVVEESAEIHQVVAALSAFAFFAGVGWLTTHGLGQVRAEISPSDFS